MLTRTTSAQTEAGLDGLIESLWSRKAREVACEVCSGRSEAIKDPGDTLDSQAIQAQRVEEAVGAVEAMDCL